MLSQVFLYGHEHEDLANVVTRCRADKLARSNHVEESECSRDFNFLFSRVISGQKIPFREFPHSVEEAFAQCLSMSAVVSC